MYFYYIPGSFLTIIKRIIKNNKIQCITHPHGVITPLFTVLKDGVIIFILLVSKKVNGLNTIITAKIDQKDIIHFLDIY